jgi:misacylated tRNA(Ala) deacylase
MLPDATLLKTLPYIIACQRNSYLKSLTSTLIACQAIADWSPPSAPSTDTESKTSSKKKKKKKKKSKATDDPDQAVPKYGLLFSDTVLFPTGGGQPNDLGTIRYKDSEGVAQTQMVLDVVRMKNDQRIIVHYVEHPVAQGTEVTIDVDWSRRFDHMQQHSAQHLITAVALETTGWPTTSWNLSARHKNNQPCYLDLGVECKEITPTVLHELEQHVNEKVRKSLTMTPTVYQPEEFAALQDVRSGSKGIKSGDGPIRTVTIEGIERNTCCGTHVQHTGHLQTVKLLGAEKGPDKTTTRVWFVAGDRVCDQLDQLYTVSTQLTRLLTCNTTEHYERTTELVQHNKETMRQTKNLLRNLAQLMAQVALYPTFAADRTMVRHVEEGNSFFMKQFIRLANDSTQAVGKATVVVSVGGGSSTAGGACMLTGEASVIDELGPALSKLLDGARGGGKNGKYQMKIAPGVLNDQTLVAMDELAKTITTRVLGL